jgi:hypothetical protein
MAAESFPDAIHAEDVGSYPALVGAGGGYVWDAVLEYRVWLHPERGAKRLYESTEPAPGEYVHVVGPRCVEWPVEFLRGPCRTPRTIADFLAANGPARRLDIIFGDAD